MPKNMMDVQALFMYTLNGMENPERKKHDIFYLCERKRKKKNTF